MPTIARLTAAIGLSTLAGGAYFMRSDIHETKKQQQQQRRSFLPINLANCSEPLLNNFSPTHSFTQSKWDNNWDSRQPRYMVRPSEYDEADVKKREELIKKVTPTAKRNIILIRHGQYVMDEKSQNYANLTPLGREQAICLGKRLMLSGIKFDNLLMSTMPRAMETANLLLSELPPIPSRSDPLLDEGSPYPPDPPSSNWRPRHKAAFRKYIHRASYKQKEDSWELIVCHANVIRYFICRALQFPPEGWLRLSLAHCSMTWIVIHPNGRVSVRQFGDCGHLLPDKITF